MSKKKIQLSIPDPCDQKFSKMIPSKGGRFCGNCEKVIVDFSKMSDDEIAKVFIKNKGKICGQFRRNQLNRDINITPPSINSYRGKAASIFLSGILTAGVANAQNNITPPQTIENQQFTNLNNTEISKKSNDTSASNQPQILKLLVTDDQGETLIGASVIIKNYENLEIRSEIDGSVEWTIPDEIKEKEISIIINYTGFHSEEFSINREKYDFNQVKKVILNNSVILGYSIVVGYSKPRAETLYNVVRNWFYKLRYNREDRIEKREDRRELRNQRRTERKLAKQIKKENFSPKKSKNKIIQLPIQQFAIPLKNIFPNPFSNEINLEIFSELKSDIQISIFDISGKKIYQVTQGVIAGKQNIYLNLKNVKLENGEYILHLKEENGQVQSRKLIRISERDFRLKN